MATLIAVAEQLAAEPIQRGSVYLLFQPAEETGTGALAVLADARFQALPPPDLVFGCHNIPKFPFGQVIVRAGLFAQASSGFRIALTGTTSHASYPEHGLNPSAALTRIVDAVNCIDKTLADEVEAPVLGTVTYAQLGAHNAGMNFGTTPGQALVTGVLRAHTTGDLDRLCDRLTRMATESAAEDGLGRNISWHERFAATNSCAAGVELIQRAAGESGLDVHHLDQPFRWSEDFGYFTDRYRGAFFGLGAGLDQPQLHDEAYDFPDALIDVGARLYRAMIDLHLAPAAASAER
jgi:metal-dependent amidase/aminoacylase/carboxypeptidase family protein